MKPNLFSGVKLILKIEYYYCYNDKAKILIIGKK
jgi:hypothetical protein